VKPRERFVRDGIGPERRTLGYALDVRYSGQVHELTLPLPATIADGWWQPAEIAAQFHRAHENAYGFADPAQACEIVNLRLEAIGAMPKGNLRPSPSTASAANGCAAATEAVLSARKWARSQPACTGARTCCPVRRCRARRSSCSSTHHAGPSRAGLSVAAHGELRISTR
jgi:N-methylhydantoinase A/oxoprolinase/acetone carboxylase beta subunit